jgi:hypothetical protein
MNWLSPSKLQVFRFNSFLNAGFAEARSATRGCMGRLRCAEPSFVCAVVLLLLLLPGCGGSKPAGTNPFPAKITITPTLSASMALGSTLQFIAMAVNGNNQSLNPTFTYSLTPTSAGGILEISPTGNACAGSWNAPYYSVCTPAGVGVVQVTATALGTTSPPTTIFVHPPVDNIQISVVPPVNQPPTACSTQIALPPACDLRFNSAGNYCLSQNQVLTLQATSYSQGVDISPLVGPVTWTGANFNVVTITPIVTSSTNVPTNQATVVSNTPGATQVVASVSGVSSQPYIAETCPVQCIALEISQNGTQNPTETNFVTNKGTSQTITATAVDVQGCVVPSPALTWTSSSPAALTPGTASTGCITTTGTTGTGGTGSGGTGSGGTGSGGSGGTGSGSSGSTSTSTTCVVSTNQAGGAAITASCTPPACNVGFPLDAPGLPSLYLPQPVYPVTAISGLATGTSTSTNVLATSQDCYSNFACTVAIYNVSTSKNIAGSPVSLPEPPNSLMFDPPGDKAYAGSQYGAFMITSANLGSSSTNPFTLLPAPQTQLGVVTGKVIAVSPNGNFAIFSDTVSTPNQVYVVSSAAAGTTGIGSTASTTVTLNIDGAITAAFSPDNSKAFILANGGNTLYVYSPVQTLQAFPLTTPANAITFSSTGAFALLAGGGPASNLALFSTCNNSELNLPITPALQATPLFLKMVPSGNVFTGTPVIPSLTVTTTNGTPLSLDLFYGVDNSGIDIIATATTTSISPPPSPTASLCSLQSTTLAQVSSTSTPFEPLHISLQKGTFHPINVFVSPDATQVYIVTSDQGVLVYSFNTQSVTAIPLLNNAAPVAADMSADGTMLYVAGTDGLLHYINTQLAADQPQPIFFSQLPNTTNNFCYQNFNCTLNVVAVRP